MAETRIVEAQVTGVSFMGAGLLDAQLDKTLFVHCDFRDTNLREGEAIETHFVDCDFRGADFELRRLKGTVFTRCKFAGVTGTPRVEGAYKVEDPDFSPAGDGSTVEVPGDLLRWWSPR
jgi:uncharacterized protein YjbI with pentapeptide repeats